MGDESGCLANIPEELVSEILCYLPVKSLIRFTIVRKSWLSLIRNNHCFAMKNYLTRTTSSSKVLDNVDYMFDSLVKSNNPCLYSFTQAKSFRFLKKFECVPNASIRVSNSCHGIICIHLLWKSEIFLYNPSIQEVVLLPPCPTKMTSMGRKALGFDPTQNDYKVVAIDFPSTDNYFCTVNLYSLRHGHWRKLYTNIYPRCTHGIEGDGASNANGRIYSWLFNKQHGMEKKKLGLLSFDMTEEVLKEFPLPKCEDPHIHDHHLLSSTRWQACLICLTGSYYFTRRGFIDVWVLRDWIWSKAIVLKFPGHELIQPSMFWINDKELFVNVKRENIVEVFHYDLVTKKLKCTGRKGRLCSSRGYVESLVSLKRLMSLHHESKHGEDGKHINDQVEASKQEDTSRYVLREVSRKGVRWSQTST